MPPRRLHAEFRIAHTICFRLMREGRLELVVDDELKASMLSTISSGWAS